LKAGKMQVKCRVERQVKCRVKVKGERGTG
jgi:hypothetical protein